MEKGIQKTSQQLKISEEIFLTTKGLKVSDSTEEEIKQALRFIFALLGTPANNIPQKEAKAVLLYFVKKILHNRTLEEIKLAFELCVSGKINIDLNLYGSVFSSKIIVDVLKAYDEFKRSVNINAEEDKINNTERLKGLIKIYENHPEELEKLKNIGEKEKKQTETNKTKLPHHDLHQKWIDSFYKVARNFAVENTNGRFVNRYGKIMDLDKFFNHKFNQYLLVQEYIKTKKEDFL